MNIFQNEFMDLAFEQAHLAYLNNEVPVGAVIIHNKKVIASAYNLVEQSNDPSAHAELIAIRQACSKLDNWRLKDCSLYVTLEPCPMCAQLISFSRIKRLYFSAYDIKYGGVENGARIFEASSCYHVPEIYGGLQEQRSTKLLKKFFAELRK